MRTQPHHLPPSDFFPSTLFELPPARRHRPSSARRGYDRKWRTFRGPFLDLNPFCLYCLAEGRMNPSECIDHNPPHQNDRAAFWDTSRWIPCCDWHNNHLATKFDGALGRPIRPRPQAPLRTSILIPQVPYKERSKSHAPVPQGSSDVR